MPLALTGYETGLLVVALVFIVFALVVALVIPRSRPEFPSKRLWVFVAVVIALFFAQLTAVFVLAQAGEADEPVHEGTPSEPPPAVLPPGPPAAPPPPIDTETTETGGEATESQGDAVAGKEVFLANCTGCHTLADAGSTGTIGPNLDAASPSADKVVERVTNGQGVMPSFKDKLSEQQIADVAAYVSSVAGS